MNRERNQFGRDLYRDRIMYILENSTSKNVRDQFAEQAKKEVRGWLVVI